MPGTAMTNVVVAFLARMNDRPAYGGERSTILAMRALRNFVPVVMCNDVGGSAASLKELTEANGIRFMSVTGVYPFHGWRRGRITGKVKAVLRHAVFTWSFAKALGGLRPAVIFTDYQGFWLVTIACRLMNVPVVQCIRCTPTNLRLAAFSCRLATASVVLTEQLRDELREAIGRGDRNKVVAIRNGIDVQRVEHYLRVWDRDIARTHLGVSGTAIGYIARLEPVKGQLPFIREVLPSLLTRYPDLHVYFIGDQTTNAAYARECLDAAQALEEFDRVHFVGFAHEIDLWYRALDIVALASSAEGIPRAILEAQAYGLPVVATALPGTIEAAQAGGILGKDLGEIERAVKWLLDHPARRVALGNAGRAYVVHEFDSKAGAESLEALLTSVAAGR
jgi:glycosyltransferase involved in cell wall biosynthesis